MKLYWEGIEWGEYRPGHYQYYVYWWNWLQPKHRYIGLKRIWYDGPHVSFGFWFFNWTWSTHWSKPPKGFRREKT